MKEGSLRHVILLMLILSTSGPAQKPASGNAKTRGQCSPATSGNNNTYYFKYCGGDPEQGKKVVELLNRILLNQDTVSANAKLDEILKLLSKPMSETNTQTCIGSACAQGPNSQATFNQLGPPPPVVTWKIEPSSADPHYWRVLVSVDSPPSIPAFIAECDSPCKSQGGTLGGSAVYADEARNYITDNPNIAVILFTPHSPIVVGKPLIWIMSSQSDKPLKILSVKLLPEEKARTLPPPK